MLEVEVTQEVLAQYTEVRKVSPQYAGLGGWALELTLLISIIHILKVL